MKVRWSIRAHAGKEAISDHEATANEKINICAKSLIQHDMKGILEYNIIWRLQKHGSYKHLLTRSKGKKNAEALDVLLPAFKATALPCQSITGEPLEPPFVPEAACVSKQGKEQIYYLLHNYLSTKGP